MKVWHEYHLNGRICRCNISRSQLYDSHSAILLRFQLELIYRALSLDRLGFAEFLALEM